MTLRRLLSGLASLRLTVALLVLAMVLIFAGTLAQTTQGVWQVVDSYFRSWLAWIDLRLFLPRGPASPLPVPFPGGLLIAALMLVNLIAAHAVRFKLTRKRVGIVLLHAGLIALLVGEFVTAFAAREGMMHIDEGGSSSYTEDLRRVELAVVDPSDPELDRVTVVPQPLLERHAASGEPITAPELPFQVRVRSWLPNSALDRGGNTEHRGVGQRLRAVLRPPARGVDGAETDVPSAYLHLATPDEDLGVWLVSANLIHPQTIEVGGKAYTLALRFAREYRPYTIELLDFRHDKFTGTEIARNFSSHVRLTDPSRGVQREAVISMNQPLRYRGETFYQASYKPDDSGTILQVVRNPGRHLPYAACIMVGLGLLWHFAARLVGFVRRREGAEARPARSRPLLFTIACLLGVVLSIHAIFRPQPKAEFDVSRLVSMPVSAGGRVKPFDTFARSALLAAGGRQTVRDENGQRSAVDYILDLITHPVRIKKVPVVRVDHPDLLTLLGKDSTRPTRLSLAEIEPHWREISAQAAAAHELPPKQRDPFQRAVVKLHAGVAGLMNIARMDAPYWVPPHEPGAHWRPFHEAFVEARRGTPEAQGAATIARIMTAYHDGDQAAFDAAVAEHADFISRGEPGAHTRAALEVWLNRAQPFLGASVVYLLALILLGAVLLLRARAGGEGLRRVCVGLVAGAFIVHTAALLLRMYLQGRPPVTNLYSSAVFVGWAAAGIGLLLERWFPVALGALASAAIGFATLVIAHNLGEDGDTMQVMQAVLDTNFWLATHVVTITLGYSTSLLAGLLGVVYLVARVFRRGFDESNAAPLASMIYGVVCAAMLLSFVGTVLGGIWADQSWGRFWGWDPKENGAALVVLMNAVILHARWGGFVRPPGVAALAVLGNAVVAWSWFGTNMLGVGLHSYGFMDSAALWLVAFVCVNMLLAALAAFPARAQKVNTRA